MNLKDAKVGSMIACQEKFISANELFKVERLTATTVVCGRASFKIGDGLMVGTAGGGGWNRRYGRIATEGDITTHRVRVVQRKLADFKVTADNLAAVEALLAAPATPAQGQTK